jgi:hypothetical protein
MARPKSANLTAAPLALLARSRFSGWKETRAIVTGHPMKIRGKKNDYSILSFLRKKYSSEIDKRKSPKDKCK